MNNARQLVFWATTIILALCWIFGGIADLIRQPDVLAGMLEIGYPAYILTILGFWKVLGAIVILLPRLPRMKEWAYAGTIFELTGAVASHVASGSTINHILWPSFFAICATISWALRPRSRTMGVILPADERERAVDVASTPAPMAVV